MSKAAAKNAKTDAGKAAKKRPDSEGVKLIEQGDAAMADKDFAKALELFTQAKARCEASSVEVVSKEKKPKAPAAPTANVEDAAKEEEERKPRLVLRNPSENLQAKPLREGVSAEHNYALNTDEQLRAHLQATGGSYRTRFPPEPNGYLHIGHAKAMNFNFGQAKLGHEAGVGGETILRFDDTNPAAEKQEFIDSILDNVAWLGHRPLKISYSSDYFTRLYDLALELIDAGGAYVCHQTGPEIKASRLVLRAWSGAKQAGNEALPQAAMSPWRDRPKAENRRLFERMKAGRYAEGEAVLRMRGDLASDNSSLWDPAAYRVLFHAHPRTGSHWCIYPTYDYTHCIVDSLEQVSHSLCTLEFEGRQAVDGPYYWLLDQLRLYKPATWEYSRLNITHCVMSKRKLKHLVLHRHVEGWDDPRLVSLDGLRRRGFSAAVVNKFCEVIGVTRSKMTARIQLLEQIARQELDATAPRRFVVLRPLKVVLTGVPEGGKAIEAANHPKQELGCRTLVLRSTIYIEADDFRETDDPKYFGLAPGKEVGLLGAGVNITCTGVDRDAGGAVVALTASVDLGRANKPRGHLHWVDASEAVPAEVRLYGVLFSPEDPEATAAAAESAEPAWLRLLNPHSLVVEHALMEPSLRAACGPASGHSRPTFQFQRTGYFCVDDSSSVERPVFNRVVALKEDKEAKAVKA